MFIQGLKDGVELQFKNPPYKKKLAKWEVRKVHEGLTAILEGWGDLPPNTRMHVDKEPCDNCPEWEILKHDKDPWLIHCPTCGRALSQ